MAEHNATASVEPRGRGLRIVLFGNPAAGKSSLLGALWQVGQSQEAVLGGKITDRSGGLTELHQRLYTNQPRETLQEVSAFPITFEPTGDNKGDPIDVILVDCDGRAAQEFLTQNVNLASASGALARTLLNADALLLIVDPSAGSAALEREFQLFSNFVQTLETYRANRNEVAGLPVFLVLSKCDLLSKPTDPAATWVQRIEDGKRKIDKRFQDFLAKTPNRESLTFGKVDVHVWGTAIKRPQLADRPAKPQEPYGVAELFRQCFKAAGAFEETRQTAQGKLRLAVVGFLGVIGAMASAAAMFFLLRPTEEYSRLEAAVRENVPGQKAPAQDRLKEPLKERLEALIKVQKDPTFSALPPETQEEVKRLREEIEAYQRLNQRFVELVQDPRFIKDDSELKKVAESLDQWSLSPDYREHIEEWRDTRLGKKEQQFRKDIKILEEAAKSEVAWLLQQADEGKKLQKPGGVFVAGGGTAQERRDWLAQVDKFLKLPPRHEPTDRIPNSSMTYSAVNRFRKVEAARIELAGVKENLINLSRLVANQ